MGEALCLTYGARVASGHEDPASCALLGAFSAIDLKQWRAALADLRRGLALAPRSGPSGAVKGP